MEVKDLKHVTIKNKDKNNKTVVIGLRITEKDKATLDALCDFLGTTRVECIMTYLNEAYAQNKDTIEIMLKKRAEVKARKKS